MKDVEIVVTYSDGSVERVMWLQRNKLRLDGVLSVVLLMPGDPQGECRSIGHDWYQIVWTDTAICLTGHDGMYMWFEPGERNVSWTFPFILPTNSIEFIGQYADTQEIWKEALRDFGDRDGQLYL